MKILLLLVTFCQAKIIMPQNAKAVGTGLRVGTAIAGGRATFFIHRTRSGHLGIGFGTTMAAGDITLFELSQPGVPKLKECALSGYTTPKCALASTWKLEDFELLSNGSWMAKISKDLRTVKGGVKVGPGANPVIYSYSDSKVMEAHAAANNMKGSTKLVFA